MNVLHTTGIDCIFMQCSAAVSDEIDIYADDTIIYIYIFFEEGNKKRKQKTNALCIRCAAVRV